MPSRATRLSELYQHLARQRGSRPPDLVRALRDHPDWPVCHCRYPIDPAAGGDGTQHPNCEQP